MARKSAAAGHAEASGGGMTSKRAVLCSVLLAMTAAGCGGGGGSSSGGALSTMPLSGAAPKAGAGSASASAGGTAQSGGVINQTVNGQLPQTITGGALSYSEYGIWNQPGANPTSGAFVTGTETPAGAMPKTGTASYAGGAIGMATNGTTSTQLAGTFNATADFGHMSVVGGMNMNQIGAGGAQTPYDNYAFSAGFAANSSHFSGSMTAANNTALSGIASGSLYGAQAQEIGGTFALQGGGTSVTGAFGGSTTGMQPTAFTGSSNVAADFGSRNVTGTMTLTGPAGSANSPMGTISLSGGTASFSGALSSAGATGTAVSGTTSGALFGAAAATTSGVFTTGGTTSTIGAFGGAKH